MRGVVYTPYFLRCIQFLDNWWHLWACGDIRDIHLPWNVSKDITLVKITECKKTSAWEVTILQYIPKNMHTVTALLCFVVVIYWLIFPYPSGLLHWHCGNLTIAPVPAKQPWWIWINTSCEFIMNDCITTTKQSTTKPCAYLLGYTVADGTRCCWISSHHNCQRNWGPKTSLPCTTWRNISA